MKNINLKTIRTDGGTQSRVKLDEATVAEYAEALREGATLPPVTVFHDGSDYWLADGFHRFHAYLREKKASIPADPMPGTRQEAKLYAAGANAVHGLKRTNEDKRRSVQMVIEERGDDWTDREIAHHCGVSHTFVSNFRKPEPPPVPVKTAPAPAAKVATVASNTGYPQAESVPMEPANDGPSEDEIAAAEKAEAEDKAAMQRLLESDAPLADAVAEASRLRAANIKLQQRIDGLLREKNEAVRMLKNAQRRLAEYERKAA